MIIYSGPLNHSILSCTKTPISGHHFRRWECELFPRPIHHSLSNFNGRQSLQMVCSKKSFLPRMAVGSNVSEDTDDMFDGLFKKYGKVVFRRNDQKSAHEAVDDDAESLSWKLLPNYLTKIRDLAETKYGRTASGDSKPNSWTLLDFGGVVVHIFLPQQRDFYNLEEFYGNATTIELPFEDQQPFRN